MKRYPSGRFALAVLFPLLLLLQSCSSTSVLGLSRSAYVEELETRLDQQSLRSSRMEEELEVVRNRDEGRMVSAEENIALLTERLEEIDSIRHGYGQSYLRIKRIPGGDWRTSKKGG